MICNTLADGSIEQSRCDWIAVCSMNSGGISEVFSSVQSIGLCDYFIGEDLQAWPSRLLSSVFTSSECDRSYLSPFALNAFIVHSQYASSNAWELLSSACSLRRLDLLYIIDCNICLISTLICLLNPECKNALPREIIPMTSTMNIKNSRPERNLHRLHSAQSSQPKR
jgi:hypothetical protein